MTADDKDRPDGSLVTVDGARPASLPSGRRVEVRVDGARESIAISSREGQVELTIRLTDAGPVLQFNSANLELQSSGDVSLRCNKLSVETEQSLSLRSKGDMEQVVDGGCAVRVGRDLEISAQAAEIVGHRGEVSLEANDDLVLNGARVMMNCPREEEVQRQGRAARDLRQLLAVPFQEPGDAQRMPRSEPVDESGEEVE